MPAKKSKPAAKAKAAPAKKAPAAKPAPRVEGITKKDIGPLQRQLIAIRDDLSKKIAAQRAEEIQPTDVGDEADIASQSLEKEINFELNDNERTMLDQAEAALRKIEKGSFGTCESCSQPIGKERIKALPFARYCINCQARNESFASR